ncbi:MAG: ATP-binding protein [Propionibacteriaceae bacterium]|jgi:hypothetical protein|nr:ATP-binding protein [Propionibacteriaceae bacterium]
MLIRFQASNYRSLAEPAELSLVAVDRDRPAARAQEPFGESLLAVAGIYGPNASGKSNVVSALAWLCDAVALSLRTWEDEIPRDPFAFQEADQPSTFELEMTVDGVRFEYILETGSTEVSYEALFHYPKRYRRRVFEREGMNVRFQPGVSGQVGIRELLTQRTLVLSAARRFEDPLIRGFADQLIRCQIVGLIQRDPRGLVRFRRRSPLPTSLHFDGEWPPPLFGAPSQALAMLRMADLGIEDVEFVEDEVDHEPDASSRGRRRIRFLHGSPSGQQPLELAQESQGTQAWINLIGYVLDALSRGSLLIVDELDGSLHPTLSAAVLRLFCDPSTNPQGAQLVFTAHDVSLLDHLNRDEVWFTEKQSDGSTRLGALAEFAGERVRKSKDLRSAYLRGKFGALPEVDRTELLRALGLIG